MNVATARAIIQQATEDDIWETEEPEDDKEAIADAKTIVEMAEEAQEDGTETPEVEAILEIYNDASDDDDEEDEAPVKKRPGAKKPVAKKPAAKPAASKRPAKKAAPEPEPEEEEDDADERASAEPWEGYDSDKISEIVEAIEVTAEDLGGTKAKVKAATELLEHIAIYEGANKNRVKITDALAAFGVGDQPEPEEDEPEAEADEDPAALEEPIENYEKLKIPEIKAAIQEYVEDEDDDAPTDEEKLEVVQGVIDYEQQRQRPRNTLLDFLSGLKEGLGDGEEEEAADDEDEADAPAKKPAARGAGRGKKAGTPAGKRTSRVSEPAGDDSDESAEAKTVMYSVTDTSGKSKVVFETEMKNSAVGVVLDLINGGATSITVDVA